MKKELALHFLVVIIFFVLVSFLRKYLDLSYWPFWAGAIIGTILPDADHFIYVYFLRPYELTSQRVMYEAQKGNLLQSWGILSSTRSERTNLILHTVIFQVLFIILGFLVISSSKSLLGRGLVLAFLLHLLTDEVLDLRQTGNLNTWFKNFPITLDRLQLNIYLISNFVIILVFGFLM